MYIFQLSIHLYEDISNSQINQPPASWNERSVVGVERWYHRGYGWNPVQGWIFFFSVALTPGIVSHSLMFRFTSPWKLTNKPFCQNLQKYLM